MTQYQIETYNEILATLEELVADVELLKPPFRNEAICERANALIEKARSESRS
jgi:hypothetical protein